jgi:hypothetical protein
MFEQEKTFCETHRDALRKQYPGKHLVIVGDKVIGGYDAVGDACNEAVKTYAPGRFMIQKVPVRPEDDIVWLSPFNYVRIF